MDLWVYHRQIIYIFECMGSTNNNVYIVIVITFMINNHIHNIGARAALVLEGTKGGPKEWGSQATAGLIALYSQLLYMFKPSRRPMFKPPSFGPLVV